MSNRFIYTYIVLILIINFESHVHEKLNLGCDDRERLKCIGGIDAILFF